jgi:hypothetical protein
MGPTTPRHIKQVVTKCYTEPLAWTDSEKNPKLRKIYMSFGTWNVRSLYKAGWLMTAAEYQTKDKLDLMAV